MKKMLFLFAILLSLNIHAQMIYQQKTSVEAARALILSLTAEQKKQMLLPLSDSFRTAWSNLPNGQITRKGLWLKETTDEQKQKVHALLRTVLSQQGYQKFLFIMQYDEAIQTRLTATNNPIATRYDDENYWLCIFGEPNLDKMWSFKFEGHHISLNITLSKKGVTCTPLFTGINPALTQSGAYAGRYIMYEEDALGKALFNSLNPDLKKKAHLGAHPIDADVMTQTGREPHVAGKEGVLYSELNPEQKAIIISTIEAWVKNMTPTIAEEKMRKIKKTINQMRFVWRGSDDVTQLHYYRLQSPACIIEFSNRDGGIFHYHTIWRDLEEDFSEKK